MVFFLLLLLAGWERVGEGLVRLEQRVTELEHKMRDHQQNQQMVQSQPTAVVRDLREQLDQLKRDLNSCGRTRYGQQGGLGRPYWNRTKGRRKSDEEKRLVCDKYLHISRMTLTEEIRRCLRMPTFDNWQWEDEEILLLLQQMYVDLNLCSKFAIDLDVLRKFLCQVYMNYNEVPFHNFQHCFTVSQMVCLFVFFSFLSLFFTFVYPSMVLVVVEGRRRRWRRRRRRPIV